MISENQNDYGVWTLRSRGVGVELLRIRTTMISTRPNSSLTSNLRMTPASCGIDKNEVAVWKLPDN